MRPLRRDQSPDSPPAVRSPRSLAARLTAAVAGALLMAALAVGFTPAPASAQVEVPFGVNLDSCASAAFPAAIGTLGTPDCLQGPDSGVNRFYDIVFDDGDQLYYPYDIDAGEGGFGIALPAATYTVTVSDDLTGATVSTTVTVPSDGSGEITFTQYYALGSVPIAVDDTYSADEDQFLILSAPGVLGNDQYLAGGETVSIVDGPYNGTATLSANGSLSYTPNPDFNGEDTISYSLLTGAGLPISEAVITITVNAVPEAIPVAVDDFYIVDEDTVLTIEAPGLLENDSVPGGGAFPYAIDDISDGTLAEGFDGSFTYTPSANFVGTTTFPYQVDDADGQTSNVATVTITVNDVNEAPPVAVDDFYDVDEDTVLTIDAPGVLANDTIYDDGTTAFVVGDVSSGTLDLALDGSLVYTPAANFFGDATVPYRIEDEFGQLSDEATLTITVNAVDDVPVAEPDSYATDEDTPLTVPAPGVLGNDINVDQNAIFLASLVTGPTRGTLTLNFDGSFTYTPFANTNGPDSFAYLVLSGITQSAPVTVSITVSPVNDPPVATPQSVAATEDTPVGITLAGTDPDGTPLTYVVTGNPTLGTLSGTGPNLTYTPNANANGPDSFAFTVSDGTATSAPATVSILVAAVNDAPVGVADSYTVAEDSQLNNPSPNLLANDFDADDSAGSLQTTPVQRNTDHGTVVVNAFGNFIYTPAPNYNGPDSFQYVVRDPARASSAPTTVTIEVTAVNDMPTITEVDDITVDATGPTGATVAYTLPTATDVEDGALTPICAPASGTVFPVAATTVTCTATDADGASATSDFTVTVEDTTPPAITVPDDVTAEATGPGGAPVTFTATATDLVDTDVAVTCVLPSGSTFPVGDTTVTCTATDDSGNTAEDTFTVTVADTAPPVITVPDDITAEATSPAGATVPFTVTATDLVDGDVTVVCRIGETVITSPYAFPKGTRTVTCTATDDSGNPATASFTVTVRDTTGPSIRWIGGPQPGGIYTVANLPAAPTCEGIDLASEVTQCRVYGYQTQPGFWTLTARARDVEGNSSVSTRTYRVVGGGTVPSTTPTPRPTQPTATPTQPPTQPTASPTRPPRGTTPPAQPTATPVMPTVTPVPPTVPPVQPTTAPTRPPRR